MDPIKLGLISYIVIGFLLMSIYGNEDQKQTPIISDPAQVERSTNEFPEIELAESWFIRTKTLYPELKKDLVKFVAADPETRYQWLQSSNRSVFWANNQVSKLPESACYDEYYIFKGMLYIADSVDRLDFVQKNAELDLYLKNKLATAFYTLLARVSAKNNYHSALQSLDMDKNFIRYVSPYLTIASAKDSLLVKDQRRVSLGILEDFKILQKMHLDSNEGGALSDFVGNPSYSGFSAAQRCGLEFGVRLATLNILEKHGQLEDIGTNKSVIDWLVLESIKKEIN